MTLSRWTPLEDGHTEKSTLDLVCDVAVFAAVVCFGLWLLLGLVGCSGEPYEPDHQLVVVRYVVPGGWVTSRTAVRLIGTREVKSYRGILGGVGDTVLVDWARGE